MSALPTDPTWVPKSLDYNNVAMCSHLMIEVARQFGFTRETYVAAVAQLAEGVTGHNSERDVDAEVLKFAGERFKAVSDAIAKSGH